MKKLNTKVFTRMILLAMVATLVLIACLAVPALAETAPAPTTGIDLTAIINAMIALIGAVLTYKVIPYLRERMTDAQYQRTMAMVKVAVYAAEEIYRSGHGDTKLQYAQEYLRRRGYYVDMEQIKAAVKEMRDAQQPGVTINTYDGTQGPEVDDWEEDTDEPGNPDNPA
ncbi:MAG: phage holin, LLH family [Eubacteriales bacterium]|nr:phage holin, LLH family [Christensenellaceae bacterium]MEA5067177.1 phage holin, LLH family [Eubacteriales bacterium]